MKILFISIFATILPLQLLAQHQISVSLFPGYHVINTDEFVPSTRYDTFKTNFIFGGSISTRTEIQGYPFEISLGYSQGKSKAYEYYSTSEGHWYNYSADLRYQKIPLEALFIHPISEKTNVLAGVNVVAQYRTMVYNNISINNDRLLSFGIGLTGKLQTKLITFKGDTGHIFGNLTARWTEYLIHNARGRNVGDFTLRHVTLAPQIGVSWNLAQQASHN
jgi:hypothetical protein